MPKLNDVNVNVNVNVNKHDAPPHYHLERVVFNRSAVYVDTPCRNDCAGIDVVYVVPADDPDATVKHLVALLVDILTSDAYLDGRTSHESAVDR